MDKGDWTEHEGWTTALGEAIPSGASWERRQPARPGDLRGDLLLPIGQALVTGLVGGLAGGILAGWRIGAIAGVVTFGLAWLVLLAQTRAGLWTIERVTGRDLDGDRVVGEPPAPTPTVRVELDERHAGGQRMRWVDLPVSDDKLRDVARAVLTQGATFSRDGLAAVLTQGEYRRLAAAMVAAGLSHDLPGNKRVLSAAGRALLRKVLDT